MKKLRFTSIIIEEEYRNYIKYIKKSKITYGTSNNLPNLNNISITNKYDTIKHLNFKGIYETELNNISYFLKYMNYDDFSIKKKKKKSNQANFIEIFTHKTTNTKYMVISNLLYLDRAINLSLILDNPCILKLIGFCENKKKRNNSFILLYNYYSNETLGNVIDLQSQNVENSCLNDTKKLIIMYGIASGMSYLHSNDIIHRNLSTETIFLDDDFYPKIGGFNYSIMLSKISEYIQPGNCDDYFLFKAPEYISNHKISKSNDVYSFSMISYKLLTFKENFFDGNLNIINLLNKIVEGYRPQFDNQQIPKCYKDLIERCWSDDPSKRPTFNDIVKELETNPSFITDQIDEEEYLKYINYIKTTTNKSNLEESNETKSSREKIEQKEVEWNNHLNDDKQVDESNLNDYEIVPLENKNKKTEKFTLNEKAKLETKLKEQNVTNTGIKTQEESNENKKLNKSKIDDVEETKEMKNQKEILKINNNTNQNADNQSAKNVNKISEESKSNQIANIISEELIDKNEIKIDESVKKNSNKIIKTVSIDENLNKIEEKELKSLQKVNQITEDQIDKIRNEDEIKIKDYIKIDEYEEKNELKIVETNENEIEEDVKEYVTEEQSNENLNDNNPTIVEHANNQEDDTQIDSKQQETTVIKIQTVSKEEEFITPKDCILDQVDLQQNINNKSNKEELSINDANHQLIVDNKETSLQLAKKYSIENDTENTYIYMKKCIEEKKAEVVLEYAVNLYKQNKFKQSKKYLDLLIDVNHPIAKYYLGIMKYFGHGCQENRNESEQIMRYLSESGIDRATEFLEEYFNAS